MLCFIVNKNVPSKPVKADIHQFMVDSEFTYEDFAKQSSGHGFATLRVQDYSWEEHGYSLANELYTEIAELLEDKFQTTQNLTYFTCVESSLHLVTRNCSYDSFVSDKYDAENYTDKISSAVVVM